MRGLGATRTLILLNGRRLENCAFVDQGGCGVDLHAIPLAALDRVGVLKDGAPFVPGFDFFQDNYNPAIADPRDRFFHGRITVRWP